MEAAFSTDDPVQSEPPPAPTRPMADNKPKLQSRILAGRGKRLAAALSDIVFCFVCLLPGALLFFGSFYFTSMSKNIPFGDLRPSDVGLPFIYISFALFILGGLGCFITQMLLLSRRGQTIGKKFFRIKIVNVSDGAQPDGVRILLLRSILVWFMYIITVVGQIFLIADICFIWREDRRCIHDFFAKTQVVDA